MQRSIEDCGCIILIYEEQSDGNGPAEEIHKTIEGWFLVSEVGQVFQIRNMKP